MASSLKNYLTTKFGERLNITIFGKGESCLGKINNDTHVVILDRDDNTKKELMLLNSIKAINPATEVIVFVENDEAKVAAELFRTGSRSPVTKNNYLVDKLSWLIRKTVTDPIRYIIREFGVSTFMLIFFSTFIAMGVVVFFVLKYTNIHF